MKSRNKPILGKEKPNAWIFEKDGLYVGFALKGTTITFSSYPREDLQKLFHTIEKSGFRLTTQGGTLQIIREKETDKEGLLNTKEAFLIRIGQALMHTFFGGDWDPDIKFAYPADLPDFEKRALEETRKIPKGKVATYGEIAERIGSPGGARAVGNALGRCCLGLIVPCHRVVKANGRVGFALAREMLERECVKFGRGKIIF